MTTEEFASPSDPEKLNENLQKIEALSQRLVAAFGHKRAVPQALQGPGPDLYMKAAAAYLGEAMTNPTKLFEKQVALWGKSLQQFVEAQEQLSKGNFQMPQTTGGTERRFSSDLWESHPDFIFVKHQYLVKYQTPR